MLTWFLFLVFLWMSLVVITKDRALPGGILFSLFILALVAQLGGMLVSIIKLPPLLGMLITGMLFRNIPIVDTIGNTIAASTAWSSTLRLVNYCPFAYSPNFCT